MRNDHGACTPEHRNQAGQHLYGNFGPDSHERQPGLLADLQEVRATTIFLIKRNDNHSDILGETTREIKLSK